MSKKILKILGDILEESLSAHSRAEWDKPEARKIIIKVIVRKFKNKMEKQNVSTI